MLVAFKNGKRGDLENVTFVQMRNPFKTGK